MRTPTYKKLPFSTRISEDILNIFNDLVVKTSISQRELTEIAILNLFENLEKDKYIFNGLDISEYAKIRKNRMVRQMMGLKRTEIKSKATFMLRVEEDIYALLIGKAPIQEVKKLIANRKLEATTYESHEKLVKELDFYYSKISEDYKKVRSFLSEKFSTIQYLESQTNRTKKLLASGSVKNEK